MVKPHRYQSKNAKRRSEERNPRARSTQSDSEINVSLLIAILNPIPVRVPAVIPALVLVLIPYGCRLVGSLTAPSSSGCSNAEQSFPDRGTQSLQSVHHSPTDGDVLLQIFETWREGNE